MLNVLFKRKIWPIIRIIIWFLIWLCSCCDSSGGLEEPGVLEQVDLTPTLALGLGLPISKNSVGRLIPAVFEDLSLRDQLRILQLNGHQLSCLLQDNNPTFHKGQFTSYRTHGITWAQVEGSGGVWGSDWCTIKPTPPTSVLLFSEGNSEKYWEK